MNFTFNNTAINIVGFYVLDRIGFTVAKRDYDSIVVPGRNGELTVDNGRWKNVSCKYQCYLQNGYVEKIISIQNQLSQIGYRRLTDTLEPTVYRMARFTGIDEIKIKDNDMARFDVNFDMMPQRFLLSGETETTISTSGSTITNLGTQPTKPLIKVSGNGTITIGGKTVTVSGNSGTIYLDSETCRAYNGTTAKDDKVTGPYLELPTGTNTVAFTGFSNVKITPRWWTL